MTIEIDGKVITTVVGLGGWLAAHDAVLRCAKGSTSFLACVEISGREAAFVGQGATLTLALTEVLAKVQTYLRMMDQHAVAHSRAMADLDNLDA